MTGEETPFTHDATSCSEEWNWWTEASTAHGEREDSCRQSWSTETKRATSESASRSSGLRVTVSRHPHSTVVVPSSMRR